MDADERDLSSNGSSFRREYARLMGSGPPPGEPLGGDGAYPPGLKIGRYEVIELIGEGTFGIVLRVRDPRLGRERAMKLPAPWLLFSPNALAEFLDEGRKAAMVDHPNVVRVYDADEAGPISYMVMEFCPDGTLLQWIRRRDPDHPVPMTWAAGVVAEIAEGLQVIHDAGLLHRDLKPGNVMLVRVGGDGDDLPNFRPKVTDFGLAKSFDEEASATARSTNREARGTYAYMSPEQAQGSRDLREASDVHALGIILYELLTGRRPFQGESTIELAGRIVKDEPAPPRVLRAGLPRDLETITLKCLEKDPGARYASAKAVAADLRNYLANRPIDAQPTPAWRRAWKWARRRPLMAASAALGAAVVATLVVGLVLLNAMERQHNLELRVERDRAERGEVMADRLLLASSLRLAQEAFEAGQIEQAQEILHDVALNSRRKPRRDFAYRHLWGRSRRELSLHWGHESPIAASLFALGGAAVATLDRSGAVILRDASTFEPIASLTGKTLPKPKGYALSPDGRRLAVAYRSVDGRASEVIYWDLKAPPDRRPSDQAGTPPREVGPAGRLEGLDGKILEDIGFFGGGMLGVTLTDEATGASYLDRYDLPNGAGPALVDRLQTPREAVFDPTGRTVAVPSREGRVDLLDPATGRTLRSLDGGFGGPPPAYSEDGTRIITRSESEALVWEVATGRSLGRCAVDPTLLGWGVSAGPLRLRMAHAEDRLKLIDLDPGREIVLDPSERGMVHHDYATFSPDGRLLVTRSRSLIGEDGRLILWDAATGRQLKACPASLREFLGVNFSPDGRTVLIHAGRALRVWRLDPPPGTSALIHRPEAWAVAYSPNGMSLATGGDDDVIRLWDAATLAPQAVLHDRNATIVDLSFSPDGSTLAAANLGSDNNLSLWDLASGALMRRLVGHTRRVRCVAFSPDGKVLASGSWDNTVRLWDPKTGRSLLTLDMHTDRIRSLAFSPDGRTLATGGEDDRVHLWDPKTGRLLRVFPSGNEATAVAFHPDGSALAWGNRDGRLMIHDLARDEALPPINTRANEVYSLAFAPDGLTIATGGEEGVVRLWDVKTGAELETLRVEGPKRKVRGLSFAPDGSSLAASSENGSVQVWRAAP